MNMSLHSKSFSASQMFREAIGYWIENNHAMSFFSLGQILFSAVFVFIGGWTQEYFLLWAFAYYAFTYAFFRFLFQREPYLLSWKLLATLVPSVKIIFLVFLCVLILAMLPFLPYVMNGVSLEVKDNYTFFLKQYMQDSQSVDIVLNVVFTVFSPYLFLRPFLAWIGAVLGRSGSILSAFTRTKGYYFPMLLLMIVFNLVFGGLFFALRMDMINVWVVVFLSAPLILFFNLVMARVYNYFFLS